MIPRACVGCEVINIRAELVSRVTVFTSYPTSVSGTEFVLLNSLFGNRCWISLFQCYILEKSLWFRNGDWFRPSKFENYWKREFQLLHAAAGKENGWTKPVSLLGVRFSHKIKAYWQRSFYDPLLGSSSDVSWRLEISFGQWTNSGNYLYCGHQQGIWFAPSSAYDPKTKSL